MFGKIVAAGALATAAARMPAPVVSYADKAEQIAGKYIVVVESHDALLNARAHAPRTVQFTHEWQIGQGEKGFYGFAASLDDMQLDEIRMMEGVKYIEPDGHVYAIEDECKKQDLGSNARGLWGLDRIDGSGALDGTYTYCFTGKGVRSYVIDTGVWREDGKEPESEGHEDFEGRDVGAFCPRGPSGDQHCYSDCHYHGTHCAGTVGGSTYGVAKETTVVGVKVLGCTGSGSWADVISGIEFVAKDKANWPGKNVVSNMSLGGGANSALNAAVDASSAEGVVHVVAAGNSRANSCNFSPASADTAITVMATDSTDTLASFSNMGPCSDIGAPGVSVLSTTNARTGTRTLSGTSMASPHVAGAVSLILEAMDNECDTECVRSILKDAAEEDAIKGNLGGAPNLLLNTEAVDKILQRKKMERS
jgi:subtilisin family serine protease